MKRIELTKRKLETLFDCVLDKHECNCGYEPGDEDVEEVNQIINQILKEHSMIKDKL